MLSRLFASLHRVAWERPRLVAAALLAFSTVAAFFAARLRFSSDISKILPHGSPAVRAVEEVWEHFEFTGQLFVFFEKKTPDASDEAAMKLADALGKRFQASPDVSHVSWKISPESEKFLANLVWENGALLLPEERADAFVARLSTEEIRATVRKNRRRLAGAGVGPADILVQHDPLDLTRDFFLKSLESARPKGKMDLSSGYFFNEVHTALLIAVDGTKPPHQMEFSRRFMDDARRFLDEARSEIPEAAGWELTLLGGYPIALQNEGTIKNDLKINLLTSIPPVLLMLVVSLRRWFGLAIGAVSLVFGILWTFGLAGALYGHLTTVTVAFSALLAGIGIDLTIHMFHRYHDERSHGLLPKDASERTYAGTGPGAFIAMITTVFSFFCLWISEFQGLREFATLVGVGLLLVFAATFCVIPLFTRREPPEKKTPEVPRWVVRACWALFGVYLVGSVGLFTGFGVVVTIACAVFMTETGKRLIVAFVIDRSRLAAALGVAITVASLVAMSRPPLGLPEQETDVTNLRNEGDVLLAAQDRLRESYGSGTEPVLVLDRGASEDEALERADAIARRLDLLPNAPYESVVRFIPPAAQQERAARRLETVDPGRVCADLVAALDAEGFDPAAFDGAIERLRKLLSARKPVRPSDIADPWFVSLRKRFVDRDPEDGTWRTLTWVTPYETLYQREDRDKVIRGLDAAAKAASPTSAIAGFQVVVKELDDRIGPDIFWASVAGAAVSCLLAWVLYGSFRWMVASIFPAIVGTFWLVGLLKAMDVKMNYLSLIMFPIMTGIATDNGLYLVERFREIGCRSAREALTSVWKSLTLVSLATTVGFGSLAFSKNGAMKSLGLALAEAMLVYLVASVILLPPLLKRFERPEAPPGRP